MSSKGEPREEKQTPWRSIIVCGFISCCQAIQSSLYIASIWPYLQLLDVSVTETFFGYMISAYSVGQIISAPLIGMWSTKINSIVWPSQYSMLFVCIGNFVYFTAPLWPDGRKWAALVGRFMVGFGAGSMSLMQTYAATASLQKDRSRAVSIITGGVSLGLLLGPGLQLLFTPLGYPGIHIVSSIYVNTYTAPALASGLINIIAILALRFVFEETYAGLANDKKRNQAEPRVLVPPYDKVAVFLCHFTRFSQFFVWANIETVTTPLAMAMFTMSREEAVKYFASSYLVLAALSLPIHTLFICVKMEKYVDLRKVCISGLMGFVLFHVVTFSWPFFSGRVKTYSQEEYTSYLNRTVDVEPVGCPAYRFSWCITLAPINIWIFFIMFIITMGGFWAEINVSLVTILSSVLGPRRQANQQSLFYSSGSVARLVGPIFISNLYTAFGPRVVWTIEVLFLILPISIWFIFYRRMVPLVYHE